MTEQTEAKAIEVVQLGTIEVCGPDDVINTASAMASTLANIINSRKLFTTISGKRYVQVEGWTTLGAMLGILPREVEVHECENGDFEATVELIRASDGAIVGRASSIVSSDEKLWATRPRYARRSMAVTRATGKAYRLGWSWVMNLAGYEATPAEEMPAVIDGEYKPIDHGMTIQEAEAVTNSKGMKYGDIASDKLAELSIYIDRAIKSNGHDPNKKADLERKLDAIGIILNARAAGK